MNTNHNETLQFKTFFDTLKENNNIIDNLASKKGFIIGPVYHASSTKGFNSFKIPSTGKNSNVFGSWDVSRNAAFFTRDEAAANAYYPKGETRGFYLGGDILDGRTGIPDTTFNSLVEMGISERWLAHYTNNGVSWEMFDIENDPDSDFTNALKKLGYEGVWFRDDDGSTSFESYAMLDPNYIKSAAETTYDDNGNPIPLEQRFDDNKNDIRY